MKLRIFLIVVGILFPGWILALPKTFHLIPGIAHAQTAPFYQGKTIRVIEGFGVGGASDLWARLIARYMSKPITRKPQIHL